VPEAPTDALDRFGEPWLGERVGEAQEALERPVHAEARAGGEAHAVLDRDGAQGAAARRVELDPEREAAGREREAPGRELGAQCRGERVAALPQRRAVR
jgi:hypothetical protein